MYDNAECHQFSGPGMEKMHMASRASLARVVSLHKGSGRDLLHYLNVLPLASYW